MATEYRRGFTLLELVIAVTVFSIVSVLVVTAILESMNLVSRESSILSMDQNAERALNGISSELQRAVLPVTTYSVAQIPPENVESFQDLLNARQGFAANGGTWRQILAAGTDFVPFSVPADFGGDGDTTDANLMLELGILLPDGTEVAAGSYVTDAGGNNVLTNAQGSLHPDLSRLLPASFGSDVTATPASTDVELSAPRFAQPLAFPANARGYGILRFVPEREEGTDTPRVLSELALGRDLNGDGTTTDTFAIGHLEVNYAPDGAPAALGANIRRIISGPMVLLQINRNADSWTPLFKLVRYNASDAGTPRTPNSNNYDGSAVRDGSYALLVRFLLWDNRGQTANHVAFNRNVPFVVRQYQTLVKLRNMSLQSAVSETED